VAFQVVRSEELLLSTKTKKGREMFPGPSLFSLSIFIVERQRDFTLGLTPHPSPLTPHPVLTNLSKAGLVFAIYPA
jgi:hypothetical protein